MACRLVALVKRPRVHLVGIRETLCKDLAKLALWAAGHQAKVACGNLQICVVLWAGIVGATHTTSRRWEQRSTAQGGREKATEVYGMEREVKEGGMSDG